MTQPSIILGAGGHARVILDTLLGIGHPVFGLTDSDTNKHGKYIRDIPILGDDSVLDAYPNYGFIVGVGENRLRSKLFRRFTATHVPINAIHPRAAISTTVRLGQGIAIMANAAINCDVLIGDNTIINTGATIDHDCVIEPNTHIAPGAHLAGNVVVGEGAQISVGAAIIPQVKIGAWAIVGAGAVVLKDVPPKAVVVGVPARVIRFSE